nr:MAG TPA: hypothetical protein [Caudoviricetes sp.]
MYNSSCKQARNRKDLQYKCKQKGRTDERV